MKNIKNILTLSLIVATILPSDINAKGRGHSSGNSSHSTFTPRYSGGRNRALPATKTQSKFNDQKTTSSTHVDSGRNDNFWPGYFFGSLGHSYNNQVHHHFVESVSHSDNNQVHHYDTQGSQVNHTHSTSSYKNNTSSFISDYSKSLYVGGALAIGYILIMYKQIQDNIVIINTIYAKLSGQIKNLQTGEQFSKYLQDHKKTKLLVYDLYQKFENYKIFKCFWSPTTTKTYEKITVLYNALIKHKTLTDHELTQVKQQFA